MRIIFLGASHGLPEPNRRCSCAMLEVQGRYYFVDMGVMVINDLITRGIPVDAVKGVFLTHMHGDHTNGLISFANLCSWYYTTADPLVCIPKIEAKKIIADWIVMTDDKLRELRYEEIIPGVIYDDGVLKVTAIPTQHRIKSYAFVAEAEGKAVLFTGDLKGAAIDFPAVAKERPLDLIVCEAAHFPATDYIAVLRECRCPKICVNHHAPWNIPHIQQLAAELSDRKVLLANDGLEINL